MYLDAAVLLRDGGDRRREPRLEGRLRGDRVDEAPRAVPECDTAAGLLGEVERAAGERVPAEHGDRAGVVQMPVGERLELRPEDVVLLLVQVELVDPLCDRLAVEAGELVDRVERIVRQRESLVDSGDELVPAALGDGVAIGYRARAALLAGEPARSRRVLAALARDLRA